jgi:hypothetical protein
LRLFYSLPVLNYLFFNMDILILPRLLIIAGTGRNSGKTTMACQLIQKFSPLYPIVAIKISPHFHKNVTSGNVIINSPDLYIAQETDPSKPKDSSRLLEAGARISFFVMTNRNNAGEAFKEVMNLTDDKDYIICESGGLRNFVQPGLFLMMHPSDQKEIKPETDHLKSLADARISFDGHQTDFDLNSITLSENKWKLQNLIL